ncbi:hypothetical protein [Nocardiopsis flavescens]
MDLTFSYSHRGHTGKARHPRRRIATVIVALATIIGSAATVATWMGWSPFAG